MQGRQQESERGFVLATALVMLSLLTLLAVSMFFTGRSSTQVSSSVQHSTEGHYYAETAVNYVIWAMRNDAEFDAFDYRGSPVNDASAVDPSIFSPLSTPANPSLVGDWSELTANFTDPGPTVISDTTTAGVSGQVMYFDNTPIAEREARGGIGAIVWPLPISGSDTVYPTLYNISTRLPRYIRLDIDASGNVTPSIPALPHASPPLVGTDIPDNGAIVWLTTGNSEMDFAVDPTLATCNAVSAPPADAMACDANPNPTGPNPSGWLRTTGVLTGKEDQHGIVAYSIGYVGGRPSSIIRAQIK